MIFGLIPKELAFPHRVEVNGNLYNLIEKYNGKRNIYFRIYNGEIDKIFFDLDNSTAYAYCCKLVKWLLQQDYMFTVLFSGGGYHVYVKCKPATKELLYNSQKYIEQLLNIKNDPHINGDVARISRVPNSFNCKRKLYCIGLTVEELKAGQEFIKQKATKPNELLHYYGSKEIDLGLLPKVTEQHERATVEIVELSTDDNIMKLLPKKIKQFLMNKELATHKNRFRFAVACWQNGLFASECNALAKKFYGQMQERNGNRTKYQEFQSEKAIEYAYSGEYSSGYLMKD